MQEEWILGKIVRELCADGARMLLAGFIGRASFGVLWVSGLARVLYSKVGGRI